MVDIAKARADGKTSLVDLETMIRQTEAILGPLVTIENDGTGTISGFDQDLEVPAALIELEPDEGAASPHAGLDELVTNGIAIVGGVALSLAAYRKRFSGTKSVNTQIPAEGRALLDTIAGTESPGYNVIYGGQTFSDFSHHPNIAVPIRTGPNKGKTSTAAGRYQFLFSTWAIVANRLGLHDFSPESQDLGAWDEAQRVYKIHGGDLETDLKAGILDKVGPALHGVWTSLPGGIEQGVNRNRFAINYKRNLAKYLMPTGTIPAGTVVAGTATGSGTARLSGAPNIDLQATPEISKLVAVLQEASKSLPDGFSVVVTSTNRPGAVVSGTGGPSEHAAGKAVDVKIIDSTGAAVPNKGEDTTHVYQFLAVAAFHANERIFPDRRGQLAWGGNFTSDGTPTGPRDLMHFDYGGDRGKFGKLEQEATA